MPVRAVIFDYGNVLCPMPRLSDYEEMRSLAGIEEPQFQDYIWRYRLDYDRGTVDGTGYWRGVAQMSGKTFSDDLIQKLVAADIALWLTPDPILLRWTRDLHDGGAKTAILSNMHLDLAVYLQSLKGLDVRAEEAVFIDDNAANVEGARALGINALRFESVAQLAAEVQGFGLPPVPMDEAIH